MLERGPALNERVQAVEHFSATGELDPNANIQFGEGGAGTFSDGKLTTRIGDELCGLVTEVFLQHGAPAEIAWKQKPHAFKADFNSSIVKHLISVMALSISNPF